MEKPQQSQGSFSKSSSRSNYYWQVHRWMGCHDCGERVGRCHFVYIIIRMQQQPLQCFLALLEKKLDADGVVVWGPRPLRPAFSRKKKYLYVCLIGPWYGPSLPWRIRKSQITKAINLNSIPAVFFFFFSFCSALNYSTALPLLSFVRPRGFFRCGCLKNWALSLLLNPCFLCSRIIFNIAVIRSILPVIVLSISHSRACGVCC